ncbi:hypothetical protein AB0C84_34930 [Actinomadura sp. NPDC048955]|uniref:hypothetical protein n=1 Tax=Actinomadura sp. NPDC048955 TaxID=3158228 RepID=UPI00340E9688
MERSLTADRDYLDGIGRLLVLGMGVDVVIHAEEDRDEVDAWIEAVGAVYEVEAARAELVRFGRELNLELFPVAIRSGGASPGPDVAGDVTCSADHGSIAAAVVNEPVTLDGGRVTVGAPTPVPAREEGHLTVTLKVPRDFSITVRLKGGDITTHGVPRSNAQLHTDAGTVARHQA